MTISVKNFTDMAAQAARQKGYLDVRTVSVQDAQGRVVQQEQLVVKGTGWLARLQRHFGHRPEGADQRVHNAFVAALKSEAGIHNLDRLAKEDRELIESSGLRSARQRIQAATQVATHLVEVQRQKVQAQAQTMASLNATMMSGFPDSLGGAIEQAHAELGQVDPSFDQDRNWLSVNDLRHYPALKSGDPEELGLVMRIKSAVQQAQKDADPTQPLPMHDLNRVMVDQIKKWITKGKPWHDALDRSGLNALRLPGGSDAPLSTARKIIAARDQLGAEVGADVFERSLNAAPSCAEHLRKMAAADPRSAADAIVDFMKQLARGTAHNLDRKMGEANFASGTSATVTAPLALSIARNQGVDLEELKANLLASPDLKTALKGQLNFLALDDTHGPFTAGWVNSFSEFMNRLLDEMDRGSDGVVKQSGAFTHLREEVADHLHSDLDPEQDGPTLQKIFGLDLSRGEAVLKAANELVGKGVFAKPEFRSELQQHLPAALTYEDVQGGLETFVMRQLQDHCSASGPHGERTVIKAASEAEAQEISVHAARSYLSALTGPGALDQPPLVPQGQDSVHGFSRPALQLKYEGADHPIPLAGFYAAGQTMRSAIERSLQDGLNQSAKKGPIEGFQDRRLDYFVKDIARGFVEIHPSDGGPALRPRKQDGMTAETDRSRLMGEFDSALGNLVRDPVQFENAKRDLAGELCHQGLIGSALANTEREMPTEFFSFSPEAPFSPLVLRQDPDQPDSLLVSWNQVSSDLKQVWINGLQVVMKPDAGRDTSGLPLEARTNLVVRYTPSAQAGQAGAVSVLRYDRSMCLMQPDAPLLVEGTSAHLGRIGASGTMV